MTSLPLVREIRVTMSLVKGNKELTVIDELNSGHMRMINADVIRKHLNISQLTKKWAREGTPHPQSTYI